MKNDNRKSKTIRESAKLLRSEYQSDNKWGIPCIGNDDVDVRRVKLLGFNNAKHNEQKNCDKTIHCFVDDNKIEGLYANWEYHIRKLAQYRYVVTPDFSMYPDMPLALQLQSVFKNRWCGAFWNDMGLKVIPSINWSDEKSFDFAFMGVKKGSIVAVSTLGAKKYKNEFMSGYKIMLKEIEPKHIICYGNEPFEEMSGSIVWCKYLEKTKGES